MQQRSAAVNDVVYLTVQGNDNNDGSRKNPVASLARAAALSRALPKGGRRRIEIGHGIFFDTSVTLDATDSGLELVASRGAEPVFYGGLPVINWRPEASNTPFLVADISGMHETIQDVHTLVVNGRMAPRARFPESGAIRHTSEFPVQWMSSTKGGWERKPTEKESITLKIDPGSLPATTSEQNAELTILHCWDESLVGIKHWDRERGIITFSTPAGHPPGAFGEWKEQARTFIVWNTREGMTRPGQWYLDRENGSLVYWPLDGEAVDKLDVIVPTRPFVLRLAGTENAPVCDVRIKGLTFAMSTTPLLAGGFGALVFGGTIEGHYAHGLRVEDTTVRWSGGQGMRILYSHGLTCRRCTVSDTGAGGIILSGNNGIVTQTLIHHNGRTYPSALGLRVHGNHWRVHHNTLHHTPYSAINAGGTALRFEYNRFHHVMETLLDGAAIYIFAAKSCVLRGNYTYAVRDVQAHAYYLDEQSEESRVEGNVAIGVPWPIQNHMARNCIIRNNVCLSDGDMQISFINCDGFKLMHNVFACDGAFSLDTSYTGLQRLRMNVFYSGKGTFRWSSHDRLPSLERNTVPVPLLPRNEGSIITDPGCQCQDGRISYTNRELADRLGLAALDVSGAGCSR